MRKTFFGLLLMSALTVTTLDSCSTSGANTTTSMLPMMQNMMDKNVLNAIGIFNNSNDFLTNAIIEAAIPKELKDINNKLNQLGLSSIVEKEKSMISQVASATTSITQPILEKAIKEMTIQDALSIVGSEKGGATKFLKNKTYNSLLTAVTPMVNDKMNQLGVNNLLTKAFSGGNAAGILGSLLGGAGTAAMTDQLNEAVTKQLVDGLFGVMEDSEKKAVSTLDLKQLL